MARDLGLGCLGFRSGVAPANQTKERSVHELFAGAFRNKSSISETGIGGVKTYRTLEGGGGNSPESCPSKTWTFDLQIGDCL